MYSGCIVKSDEIDEDNGDGENNRKSITVFFIYNYA